MGRNEENAGFACARCGASVEPLTNGSYRNHCPFCLWSRHVDRRPGDRAAACGGPMEPVAVRRGRKGLQLVHRCRTCGALRANRVAEATRQPDDFRLLLELMSAPLAVRGNPARAAVRRGPPR